MANLMKYVNNNFNQLPSYCFAEENLITDHCQTTSSDEMHAVPLVSPKETLCDSSTQMPRMMSSVRPPPGFTPLDKQTGLPEKSTTFCNDPLDNAPNKTPAFDDVETTTNPFLYNEESDVIPNDIAKSLFIRMWKENIQLQLKLTEMFGEMLEYTPLSRTVFDNHMKVQCQLNKILKSFEKAMTLNNERFLQSSFHPSKETTSNDISSAQSTPINSNNEVFGNQGVANYVNTYSPNMVNVDAQTCWSQSDQFNPQVSLTTTIPTTVSSTFSSCQLSAGPLFSNTSQGNDNVSSSQLTHSSSLSNNDASLDFPGYKNEYANVIKETNPFKLYMTGNTEMPKTPETVASYDSDFGYLSVHNLQNHISKIATLNADANFHKTNDNFASAKHVNVNSNENYSSKIVYEAGPVMYNTKQQTNVDARQSTCNSNLNMSQNVSVNLEREGTEILSSPVNNVVASHLQKGILRNNESYATQSPTDCMPQSPSPIINEELKYYQQDQTNIPRSVSARTWRQVEFSEHWINSKFQNNVCLQDKENCTTGTLVKSSPQDWNYDNIRKSAFPNMNGTIDSHAINNNNNKEKLMDVNMHFLYNPISNTRSIFVFQKIDSIENISFIFHFDREGWMLLYEFVENFTNFKLYTKFVAVLEAMNVKITLKEIDRSKYPVQFSQLDRFPLKVPRDSEKRISSISLISLPNVLSILLKLKIISREEIDDVLKRNEFRNDSILRKVETLLCTYRELKRRIEQYVNCRIVS